MIIYNTNVTGYANITYNYLQNRTITCDNSFFLQSGAIIMAPMTISR